MKTAYPTSGELTTRLTALGLTLPSDLPALTNAIAQWEAMTGLKPFLAGTATERTFTMTGQESLPIVAATVTTVTLDGIALTSGTDYFIEDRDQAGNYRPITEIMFPRWIASSKPGGLAVTAQWGWATQIEDDVWEAVLSLAVAEVVDYRAQIAMISAGITGGPISKVRQADVSIEYATSGDGATSPISHAIRTKAAALAAQYRIARVF